MLRPTSVSLTIAVSFIDLLTALESAVAVLDVVVVLLPARISRRFLIAAASNAAALPPLARFKAHVLWQLDSPAPRAIVNPVVIVIVPAMALENQHASAPLRAQAELVDLSHGMMFVRDLGDTISFLNDGATCCHGWASNEAHGRCAYELLETSYRLAQSAAEANLMSTGRGEGVVRQRTKRGSDIVLETCWALRRNEVGRPISVLGLHPDITEREAPRIGIRSWST